MSAVTHEQPYGRPAGREQIVIVIDIGPDTRRPYDIIATVGNALREYAKAGEGLSVPFNQQPGYARGEIRDWRNRHVVGSWEVRES